ncbi:hypothetical protein V3C99_017823, partial [Haemonchus contortus]
MGRCSKTIAETLSVSRRTVDSTIKRFKELGTLEDRPGRGRKTTATSTRNVKVVRDMVRRNPKRSMRKIAKKLGISHTSARRIVKEKLGLTPYRCRKVHLLTASMKKNRVQKCKMLLQRFASARHRDIIFSDEKLFTLESTFNRQNDRVLCSTAEEANESGRIHGRSGHAEKIMVWAAITYEAKSPLVFIDSDVKINTEVYLESVLKNALLPRTQCHFGSRPFVFQQDSAPAHRAKVTQQWCRDTLPGFISAQEWPSNSPDLNPMDYSVWSLLESKACSMQHHTIDSLKRDLLRAWEEIPLEYLRATVDDFPSRLRACVRARGGI